jgi:hypothetical protein
MKAWCVHYISYSSHNTATGPLLPVGRETQQHSLDILPWVATKACSRDFIQTQGLFLDNGLKQATTVLFAFIKHSYLSPVFATLIYQHLWVNTGYVLFCHVTAVTCKNHIKWTLPTSTAREWKSRDAMGFDNCDITWFMAADTHTHTHTHLKQDLRFYSRRMQTQNPVCSLYVGNG